MRLSKEHITLIMQAFASHFPDCRLYLFGSRTDDSKKGGDIDLLILSEEKFALKKTLKFGVELKKKIGDRKIDILNHKFDNDSPFHKLIMMDAMEI